MERYEELTTAYLSVCSSAPIHYTAIELAGWWLYTGDVSSITEEAKDASPAHNLAQKLAREALEQGGQELRVQLALNVAANWPRMQEGHHLRWVIDQMVRALTGDGYTEWVATVDAELTAQDEENDEDFKGEDIGIDIDEICPRKWNPGVTP